MRWKSVIWRWLAGVVPLSLAGSHAAAHALAGSAQVEVRTFAFAPDTLRVDAGTRIQWTNRDAIEHTVTWGTPDELDARLESASLDSSGAIHTATPREPGRYGYFCDRHRFMRGMVIVTSPGEHTND